MLIRPCVRDCEEERHSGGTLSSFPVFSHTLEPDEGRGERVRLRWVWVLGLPVSRRGKAGPRAIARGKSSPRAPRPQRTHTCICMATRISITPPGDSSTFPLHLLSEGVWGRKLNRLSMAFAGRFWFSEGPGAGPISRGRAGRSS